MTKHDDHTGGETDPQDTSQEGSFWDDLDLDAESVESLPELLSRAAREWPTRTVLDFVDEGSSLTFAEFYDQVQRIAGGLVAIGVRPGDRVGIMLRNVVEFPVTWMAIIEAQAVAVPINPGYRSQELRFIAEDTGLSAMVLDAESVDMAVPVLTELGVQSPRIVLVGDSPSRSDGLTPFSSLQGSAQLDDGSSVDLDSIVSIQYTSGTTGLPKGCMLTHRYWYLMSWTSMALQGPCRHILGDPPFYYMQNQGYLISALLVGATLHVTKGLSLRRFTGWLHDYDIDFAWVSDSLLDLPPALSDRGHKLHRAPTDALDPQKHRELEERFGIIAREWYASTEVGFGTVSPWDDLSAVGDGSMGYPAPFRETKLVDGELNDLIAPAVGELCVRGPGMMLGYWNRSDENAELFIEGGWFRTGDVVRIDESGNHFFLGRAKDMIRRSGENISAMEIERTIEMHPDVIESAAVPVPDPYRGEEVKLLVVSSAPITPEAVQAWILDRLAKYKAPRYVDVRSELPRTPSGKIWKAGLKSESSDLRIGAYDLVDRVQR